MKVVQRRSSKTDNCEKTYVVVLAGALHASVTGLVECGVAAGVRAY